MHEDEQPQQGTTEQNPQAEQPQGFMVTSIQDVLRVVEQTLLHMNRHNRSEFLRWMKKTKNKLDMSYPLGYKAVETPVSAERPPEPPPVAPVVDSPTESDAKVA